MGSKRCNAAYVHTTYICQGPVHMMVYCLLRYGLLKMVIKKIR